MDSSNQGTCSSCSNQLSGTGTPQAKQTTENGKGDASRKKEVNDKDNTSKDDDKKDGSSNTGKDENENDKEKSSPPSSKPSETDNSTSPPSKSDDFAKALINLAKNLLGNFAGAGGGGESRKKRKLNEEEESSFTLDAIGGLDNEIAYLQRSVILPLIRPDVLQGWGIQPPKGILFHGPPGTGKTYLAKAFVTELNKNLDPPATFIYRKGGDVFSKWHGESEQNLRAVFRDAKACAPSVLFFDEIDALCSTRDNNLQVHYSQVVSCFLGEMDGLGNDKVFVIGATNRVEALDPAVLRPGRFDKHIQFGFPDETARRTILRIHTRKWGQHDQLGDDLVAKLARSTIGYSGADLEKLCKDVVYKAIESHGGILDEGVTIQEGHWFQAMGEMQATPSNTFGSVLFIPTRPNQLISRLIQSVVHQAMKKIEPLLTPQSLALSSPTFTKSVLIHITPDKSKAFMDNHIIHGILSEEAFQNMSIFQLSPAIISKKLLSGARATLLAVVNDVVQQVLDNRTGDLSCLLVLEINEILQMAGDKIPSKLILSSLAKVRGPMKLLLATSSIPIDQMEDSKIGELFPERTRLEVNNLNWDQLYNLFDEMFMEKIRERRFNRATALVLNDVLDKAARYAEGHNYDDILNLYDALGKVELSDDDGDDIDKDPKALEKEYEAILGAYQRSKLRGT